MRAIVFSLAFVWALGSYGQTTRMAVRPDTTEDEPWGVVEIGGALSGDLKGFTVSGGPSLAFEFTPVKEWLEIELGATQSYSKGVSEWSFDLLFKKPYTISRTLEFMAGLGPEFSLARLNGRTANVWGGEFALDFMYWPFKRRRFGFYLEPAYDYSSRAGNGQSVGFSGGLLVGIK